MRVADVTRDALLAYKTAADFVPAKHLLSGDAQSGAPNSRPR